MTPPKTALRPPMRDEPEARTPERGDGLIRNRLGEVINVDRVTSQDDDKFDLIRMGIHPEAGWTYEWRVKSIKGAVASEQMVEDAQRGWTPVPAERHDGKCMPKGFAGAIERGGLILCERPAQLTKIARDYERRSANDQVNNSRSMAGLMGRQTSAGSLGIVDFDVGAARGASGVRVEREARQNDAQYQYRVDE